MTTTIEAGNEWKNLFGVCAGLGEDLGFNPLALRIAFGVAIVFAPLYALAAYAVLGVIVLSGRLLFPNRKRQPVQEAVGPAAANDTSAFPLAA